MAVYVPITDPEIAPESPVTSVLQHKLRDNPLAIAEGDPSAPGVSFAAIGVAAGDVLTSYPEDIVIADFSTVYAKYTPGIYCGGVTGIIRIKFALDNGFFADQLFGQLRFNGTDIGPERSISAAGKVYFDFDFTLTGPGIIELFARKVGSAILNGVGELAIYTTGTIQFTRENLNSEL